jgi:hypothetical protein
MKLLNVLLAASTVIIASSAVAADPTIFTERYVSNPTAVRAFLARDYAGISKDKPCSDLVLRATYDMQNTFSDHSYADDSKVFLYRAGAQATCYKRTLTMARSGNIYSTGDIKLIWDELSQTYTKAVPDTATVDVSKG